MSIGSGITLFVIGAILAFAVHVEVDWIDLQFVGYLLMGAGALVFLLGIILLVRRRRVNTVTRHEVDPATGRDVTRRTTSSNDSEI
ncbi:hypothetical protein GCM10011490_28510 [Pseudoclavibacter endophyticus]|uniref:DUF6458 domain-containing protein n=1 Tax=Pseudoclavibacter endophyticus TaxID=1778590 RepID=A0A6H9WIU8_9MICO|nr:DUF6458 family protein [Pseudoclavibacter endophyticus]KAB1646733.1 hypothetical protein F8O04_13375 [Pseudoclavibacter endophyticus]GGA76011.1 hypothetical protein GCM10011490_28510 [Pseudoclavibacter endophyticus]